MREDWELNYFPLWKLVYDIKYLFELSNNLLAPLIMNPDPAFLSLTLVLSGITGKRRRQPHLRHLARKPSDKEAISLSLPFVCKDDLITFYQAVLRPTHDTMKGFTVPIIPILCHKCDID